MEQQGGFQSTIILIRRDKPTGKDASRIIRVEMMCGTERRMGSYEDFARIGLEPDALIGLTVEEAEQVMEKLKLAIERRKTIKERGLNKTFVNVAPFDGEGGKAF